MRFNHHSPHHWLVVAIVAVVALFTLGHARGQGASASAAFEGRPATAAGVEPAAPVTRRSDVTVVPRKDEVAQDMRSPVRKAKRAAKRSFERSRTGVGGIDTMGHAPN